MPKLGYCRLTRFLLQYQPRTETNDSMEGEPTGAWAATANRSVPSGMVIVPSSFRNAMAPIAGRLRSIAEVLLLTAEGRPEGDYNGRQFAPLAQRQSSGLLIRGSGSTSGSSSVAERGLAKAQAGVRLSLTALGLADALVNPP